MRVACLRWPVEEDFEFGKDHFGLDHSQVRLHTALLRPLVLTMAALAVCAITAAHATTRAPTPILPRTPDDQAPDDPGLIALTVAEIKRLFTLLTRHIHPKPTTYTGSGGNDAPKPAHDGPTTEPDSADKQQLHHEIKVRLPY